MRVLMWCALYRPSLGGEERYVERLAAGLRKAGSDVEIVTNSLPGAPAEETIDGVRVTRLPFPASTAGDLAAVRAVRYGLATVLDRLHPDVLDLHTSGPSLGHYELHRRAIPAPLVITFHGVYGASSDHRGRISSAISHCAASIAASAATKRSLEAIVGAHTEIAVRYPAVAPETKPVMALPSSTFSVLGVGRIVAEKGWETLIRAFPFVLQKLPTARLVIVGDGPERERLEGLAALTLPAGTSSFVGPVTDAELTQRYDDASVVVVPSHHDEGFGMVAIEASDRGRPVVASDRGGLVEAVVNGVTGLLVPATDEGALASALIAVLHDRVRSHAMGEAGRVHASQFSVETLARDTLTTFERASRG